MAQAAECTSKAVALAGLITVLRGMPTLPGAFVLGAVASVIVIAAAVPGVFAGGMPKLGGLAGQTAVLAAFALVSWMLLRAGREKNRPMV